MEQAIIIWASGRQERKSYRSAEEMLTNLSIAKLLGARVLCQIAGEWVWA